MGHYKANVRDLEFNLFEVLELEKALATGEFGDLDGEAIRQMLAEAARLAQGPLAESFADGDRNPPAIRPRLPCRAATGVVQVIGTGMAGGRMAAAESGQ
jgi:Acyl-CoA dehydrogenase N terminal